VRLRVLGPVVVEGPNGAVAIGGPKERALLAFLALHANHAVSDDVLVDALWPRSPPRTASRTMQAYVSRLRKALTAAGDGARLESRPGGVVLAVDPGVLDVDRVTNLLAEADAATLAGDSVGAALSTAEAQRCWRGRPLEEFGDLPWAVTEAARLEELRLHVVEQRIDAELRCGRHGAVVGELESLCAAHPLRERLWELRMLALYRAGRQADALRAYQELRRRLGDELGIDPAPALVRLEQRILQHDPSLEAIPLDEPAVDNEPVAPSERSLPAALAFAADQPFVGRDVELSELATAWARAARGSLEVALLAGEPGIGKTTLAARQAATVLAAGGTVLFGRCDEESLVPFQPFVEALASYADATPVSTLREQLTGHDAALALLVPTLARRLPELADVQPTGAEVERYRLFEAVPAVLRSVAADAPVLLVVDDLHWADRPTLQLLQHVIRRSAGVPMLVLGTYRDTELVRTHPLADALADMRRSSAVRRVLVRGLGRGDVVRLVAGNGDPRDADVLLAEALWRETEGSPLFLREILRHLAETGAVSRDDGGRWRARRRIDQLGIPEGVREVIGRRLSRLSESTNAVLRAAAVLGREVRVDVLERIAGVEPNAVLDALDEAEGAGVVSEVPGCHGRYAFTHALLRHALYDELSLTRRVRLHQRVGEALEAVHVADPAGPHLAELAHHYSQAAVAGLAGKAIEYGRRAAAHARARVAYEEAARLLAVAYEVAEDAGADAAVRADLLLDAIPYQWFAGRGDVAKDLARQVESLVGTDDPERFARAALGHAGGDVRAVWAAMGDTDGPSIELLERALEVLPDSDSEVRARVLVCLARETYYGDDAGRSAQLAAEAIAMARRVGDPRTLASVLCSSALAIYGPDSPAARLALAQEASAVAAPLGDDLLSGHASLHQFHALCELGRVDDGVGHLRSGMQVLRTVRDPLGTFLLPAYHGGLALLEGRVHEGLELFRESFRCAQELRDRNGLVVFGGGFGVGFVLLDRCPELTGLVFHAFGSYPSITGSLRAIEALVAAESGDVDVARRVLDGVDPTDPLSLRRDVFWTYSMAALARACWRIGDAERCASLYPLLRPYAEQFAGIATVGFGLLHLPLAWCAATAGDLDAADEHFAVAATRADALGWRAASAEARAHWAMALAEGGRPGDAERADALAAAAATEADELGLVRVARDAASVRTGAPTVPTNGPQRDRAIARLVRRGRGAVAVLARGSSDEELVSRFGQPLAQRALFAALAAAYHPSHGYGFAGDISFELRPAAADVGGASDWWTIEVRGRRATARRGRSDTAAVVLRTALPDFIRLCAGELHAVQAINDLRVDIDGDVLLAARLNELFGIPTASPV
jgi:DNA-binding SARP family transcriptional activator